MKPSRYSESEIRTIVEKYKTGSTVAELCREYEISPSTLYAWKFRFGCEGPTELTTLCRLQKENRRLRQRIAEMNEETDKLKGKLRRHKAERTPMNEF